MTNTATAPTRRDRSAVTGLLAAVVFVGGLVVVGLLSSGPEVRPGDPAGEIQRFFLDNGDVARLQALLQATGALFLVMFAASLTSLVQRAEQRFTALSAAILAGGILAGAFLALSALLAGTLGAEQIADSPATVSALRQLSFLVGGAGHVMWLGVLVGAAALATRRLGLLPRWLTTAGLVSAAFCIAAVLATLIPPTAVFIPLGRFSGLLVIALASVFMVRGKAQPDQPPGPRWASVLGGVGAVVAAILLLVLV